MDDHKKFKKMQKRDFKTKHKQKFINLSQKWIERVLKQNIRIILIGRKTIIQFHRI